MSFENGTAPVDLSSTGYVAGGGLEYALRQHENILLRVEALYYGFNENSGDLDALPDGDAGDFAEFDGIFSIRGGVSLKF